jgi:hypothetical protein
MKLNLLTQALLVGVCAIVLGGCSLLGTNSPLTNTQEDAQLEPTTQPVSDDPVQEAEVIEQELLNLNIEQDFESFSEAELTE